jgi:hypothetical protein
MSRTGSSRPLNAIFYLNFLFWQTLDPCIMSTNDRYHGLVTLGRTALIRRIYWAHKCWVNVKGRSWSCPLTVFYEYSRYTVFLGFNPPDWLKCDNFDVALCITMFRADLVIQSPLEEQVNQAISSKNQKVILCHEVFHVNAERVNLHFWRHISRTIGFHSVRLKPEVP